MKVCLENTFRGIKDESSLLFTFNDIFSKYYYVCNVYILTLVILIFFKKGFCFHSPGAESVDVLISSLEVSLNS